ncbi:crossover junction endodeoxyribonuclease RuvC [bacterium 1XD42-1]|nr:crossover junction endodeoxyribonuclease RuvC [Oscillospiraceae bacterium]RKJ55132.1 crossover junction endodeoxyribonuclease RuvC [bacterium 1XD42-8]RKJ63998.1 crossover junction endodeoxyribonuclease RuvC [bacterium 1XD42-1]
MIILGIDPGYATIGYGAVKYEKNEFYPLRFGAITTSAQEDFPARLEMIYDDMEQLLRLVPAEAIAVEKLYFSKNKTTGIAVAHARGVILLAAQKHKIPIFEYTPMQVKQSVVGYGLAEKGQVMEMTRQLLKLKEVPRPDDTADALALAVCHGHCSHSLLRYYR